MSVVGCRVIIDKRKASQMTNYEIKMRYKELMRIAESDTMLASEFDELMAMFAKLKSITK
jgi:hypothetical protein